MRRLSRFLSLILSVGVLPFVLPGATVIAQTQESAFEYVAKVVCGTRDRNHRVVFATSVNIHNPGPGDTKLFKKLALTFPPGKQQPGDIRRLGEDALKPDQALQTDCADIAERAFGIATAGTPGLAAGASTTLTFTIPTNPNCFNPDCEFRIIADSALVVPESDETNNIAAGVCLG